METQKELFKNLKPTSDLPSVQLYIKKVLQMRGLSNQTAKDKLLLLSEEVGELTKAVRKNSLGASVDKNRICNYDSIESEIADV